MCLRILVVDDEKVNRSILTQRLNTAGYVAEGHENPHLALHAFDNATWDVVLTDLCMPGMDGIEFMKEVKARAADTSVIIMTAFGDVQSAVEAMQSGAADYLAKPFIFDELKVRLENVASARAMKQEVATLRRSVGAQLECCGMLGASPQMLRVFELVDRFADNPSSILIIGEPGTGKEQVARALHMRSSNSKGPFVVLDLTNVPQELAESELFGHEPGAFTGATRRRKGRMELAQGGSLFLNDIDEMSLALQEKLMRVIQERKFERVGGEQTFISDVRIIVASKVNLEDLVAQDKFRDDLMHRLRFVVISIAPLRERREEILLLAKHFLSSLASLKNSTPKKLTNAACAALLLYQWPGNVRELRQAMEYAVAMAAGLEIQPFDLPVPLATSASDPSDNELIQFNLSNAEKIDLREQMDRFEQALIHWAMTKAEGHQGKAAELLCIPRTTLQCKMKIVEKPAEKQAAQDESVTNNNEIPAKEFSPV